MTAVTALMSVLMVVLGVAMIGVTLAGGGGPVAYGIVVGLLFVAAGGGRLWAHRRR